MQPNNDLCAFSWLLRRTVKYESVRAIGSLPWQRRAYAERERERKKLGAKLLHLFTIPFGVYEKDRQTGSDVLAPCQGEAGASTHKFIAHFGSQMIHLICCERSYF